MIQENPPQAVRWSEAEPFRVGKSGEDSYEDIFAAFRAWEQKRGFKAQKFNNPKFGSQSGGQG